MHPQSLMSPVSLRSPMSLAQRPATAGAEARRRTPSFGGLWIPLVTPFREGAVDHAALAGLTRSLAATGIAGFVVCGSTGEAAALDESEQRACLETVATAAGGLPLIMGVGGEQLARARHQVQALSAIAARGEVPGLVGLLVPAPCYVRPDQHGLRAWFEILADAADLPLIVYDIPYRTGATISRELLLHLAEHPNIVAVKDCGGDLAKTLSLLADGRLEVLVGEDLQLFAALSQGAGGAIAASAHVRTADFLAVMAAIRDGRLDEARAHWFSLLPWLEACFAEPNPGPLKTVLASQGLIQAEWRLPMTGVSPTLAQRLSLLADAAQG